ncbi:hypothetical protein [Bacillus xiapuensis]|uniref:Uncharacterized protein n=1 Tax=Bacillus xiapuensis TaxID=2014075 RepID=A0ABU6NAK4_9BACI|nr:hypothetical protein [Bacillus xiapuensis]
MNVKDIEKRYAEGYGNGSVSGMIQMQNDMEWLIEQAQKVEELENRIEELELDLRNL